MNLIRDLQIDEVRHAIQLGKAKPTKQKKTSRQIIEKQLEAIVKLIVFWRDGQECVERKIDGARCGNGLQWGHFVPRNQSGWLKFSLATFAQCGNHNNLHFRGAKTMDAWFAQTFGATALHMMDEEARAHANMKRPAHELRDMLAHYDQLYQDRFYVDLNLPALVAAGYYGDIIQAAWQKEGKI